MQDLVLFSAKDSEPPEGLRYRYQCEKGSMANEVREHVEVEDAQKPSVAAAPFLKANARPVLEWVRATVRKECKLNKFTA